VRKFDTKWYIKALVTGNSLARSELQ